jgi:hypothetical protein
MLLDYLVAEGESAATFNYMKAFFVVLGMSLFAVAGCASKPAVQSPNDVLAATRIELSHTIEGEPAVANREPVGTTTVTSAAVPETDDTPLEPMPLPGERMPLSEAPPITEGDLRLDSRY